MKQILKSKFWIVAIICLALALSCEDAFARGGRGGGNRGGGFAGRRGSYYYRGGNWYRHGWLGSDIFFSALAAGALIDSLPPRYTTVVYGGVPYYYYDGYYYRPYSDGGYVVVEPPVAAQPVVAAQAPIAAAPAQPQAPAVPAVPPVLPFVAPAQPKTAALLTDIHPADHFVPHDPPQATTGVRTDPPADEQASVPADGTMQQAQPLNWQPFNTGGR